MYVDIRRVDLLLPIRVHLRLLCLPTHPLCSGVLYHEVHIQECKQYWMQKYYMHFTWLRLYILSCLV